MPTSPAHRSGPARPRRLLTGNARILELGVPRTGPGPAGPGRPGEHVVTAVDRRARRHLVAPRMKPWQMKRCRHRKTTSVGRMTRIAPAEMISQCAP